MGKLVPAEDEYTLLCKELDDGRHACLLPMTFGKVRLVVETQEYKHETVENGW